MSKLPIKKLYLDSRNKTSDSISDSNFKIELPYTITMPQDAVFFVTDVCIPYLWRTIDLNINDHIYFSVGTPAPSFPFTVSFQNYTGIIPAGNYGESDLASAINSVVSSLTNGNINVTFSVSTSVVTIITTNPQTSFRIFTDTEVINTFQTNNPMSINEIILNINKSSYLQTYAIPYVIKRLNLQKINNIYLTSPNIGSFDTISSFSNNVLKKIPVNVSYGFMIIDQFISGCDFLHCGGQSIRTLEFHLRDGLGNYINMPQYVTFSIVFDTIKN